MSKQLIKNIFMVIAQVLSIQAVLFIGYCWSTDCKWAPMGFAVLVVAFIIACMGEYWVPQESRKQTEAEPFEWYGY